MLDKIFSMLIGDKTEYTINSEKQHNLKQLSTGLQWMMARSMLKDRLINMQWFLMQFAEAKNVLNKNKITLKEFYEYIEKNEKSLVEPKLIKETKGLLVLAVTEEYLIPKNMVEKGNYFEKQIVGFE